MTATDLFTHDTLAQALLQCVPDQDFAGVKDSQDGGNSPPLGPAPAVVVPATTGLTSQCNRLRVGHRPLAFTCTRIAPPTGAFPSEALR